MPERQQTADVAMAMLDNIARRDGPNAGVRAARALVEVAASLIAVTLGPDGGCEPFAQCRVTS